MGGAASSRSGIYGVRAVLLARGVRVRLGGCLRGASVWGTVSRAWWVGGRRVGRDGWGRRGAAVRMSLHTCQLPGVVVARRRSRCKISPTLRLPPPRWYGQGIGVRVFGMVVPGNFTWHVGDLLAGCMCVRSTPVRDLTES